LGYEPRGRGFDSCQPHQYLKPLVMKVTNGFFTFNVLHKMLHLGLNDSGYSIASYSGDAGDRMFGAKCTISETEFKQNQSARFF
ncbi:MAG: hypothetical protein ABI656_05475, partial [bacterium]